MANYNLSNAASEINLTLCCAYTQLTGSYVGPTGSNSISSAGFLIQNGNKQSGLFVGNTCIAFYNNLLDFTKQTPTADVYLKLPNNKNFYVSGDSSTQVLDFNAVGTLSIGSVADVNYKGLQVINDNPIILLKDTGSTTQIGINFFNSAGTNITTICQDVDLSINGIKTGTHFGYCKYFALKSGPSSNTPSLIVSGNYLTVNSGTCINNLYELSVGGSGYFTKGLYSQGGFQTSGDLCIYSNNYYLLGSGDMICTNICNQKTSGSGAINFYNHLGGLHSQISSVQKSGLNANSEIYFYTTPNGLYNSTDRKQLALKISGDKTSTFYGNICSETGIFNYFLRANCIENSGCRTYFNFGADGNHYFSLVNNEYIYGFNVNVNTKTPINHYWFVSGNSTDRGAMRLDSSKNLTISGSLISSGVCSVSGLIVNNNTFTDSCITSRCVILSASGNSSNIILSGNLLNNGGIAQFSGICSTGNQLNNINGCLSVTGNVLTNGSFCALNSITGACGIFTTCMCAITVCSNNLICAGGSVCAGGYFCSLGSSLLNCFGNSIHTNGYVSGTNTAKAWGFFTLNDGVLVSNSLTGFNFSNLSICSNTANTSNFLYTLELTNAVKYPFSLQMSAIVTGISGSAFQWNASLASNSNNTAVASSSYSAGLSPNFITPIASGVNTSNLSQFYVNGNYYCKLHFLILNCKYLASQFSDMTKVNQDGSFMFTIHALG